MYYDIRDKTESDKAGGESGGITGLRAEDAVFGAGCGNGGSGFMTITTQRKGTALEIALKGRLDTSTAPQLEAELKGSLEGAESLILDFSGLDYISSAGLRVLLAAHKAMSGRGGMKVTHVSEMVAEVFEVTGFSDILSIE